MILTLIIGFNYNRFYGFFRLEKLVYRIILYIVQFILYFIFFHSFANLFISINTKWQFNLGLQLFILTSIFIFTAYLPDMLNVIIKRNNKLFFNRTNMNVSVLIVLFTILVSNINGNTEGLYHLGFEGDIVNYFWVVLLVDQTIHLSKSETESFEKNIYIKQVQELENKRVRKGNDNFKKIIGMLKFKSNIKKEKFLNGYSITIYILLIILCGFGINFLWNKLNILPIDITTSDKLTLLNTIWQIQGMTVTLIIALLSIFVTVYDVKYFGLKIIDFVSIGKGKVININYWDEIIISLFLIIIMYIFVINMMLASAIFLFICSIFMVIFMVHFNIKYIISHFETKQVIQKHLLVNLLSEIKNENDTFKKEGNKDE